MIVTYEVAALPKQVTEDFLKAMYGIILIVGKEGKVGSALEDGLKKWAVSANSFVTRFKLKSFNDVWKQALREDQVDDEKLQELGTEVRKAFNLMTKEHDISGDRLRLIKAAGRWLRRRSASAYRRLERNASSFKDSAITNEFIKQVGSQGPIIQSLKKMVKRLSGKDGLLIPAEDAPAIKKKNKPAYKEYLRARKAYNQVWKDALQTYVRKSGKHLVDYQSALKYLKNQKLQHSLPEKYEGMIDDQGRMYTKAGKILATQPSPFMPWIVMNKNYDPQKDDSYVFFARKGEGISGRQFYYTLDYTKQGRKEKFEGVSQLIDNIKGIRNKWMPMLKNGVSKPEGVAATILEMILQFSARPGTKDNATEGKPTFGITTLKVKNVKPQPNGNILISYVGKAGVSQKHLVEKTDPVMKYVAKNLIDLCKNKEPSDDVFTATRKSGGKTKHINVNRVNKFFKKLGSGGLTVKSLRTMRGTMLFKKVMDEALKKKKPKGEKEAKELFEKLTEMVGEQLGHVRNMRGTPKITGKTAQAAYIDPALMNQFWKDVGMRPPANLEKALGKD